MAETTPAMPSPVRRSRTGCRECRRRHRRCDEAKPACSYCVGVQIQCEYSKDLSWGGRPFNKSRFGQCIGQLGVVKVASEPVKRPRKRRRREADNIEDRDASGSQFVYSSLPKAITRYRPEEACTAETDLDVEENVEDGAQRISPAPIDSPTTLLDTPEATFEVFAEEEEDALSPLWVRYSSPPQSPITLPELYPLSSRFRTLLAYFQFAMSRSFSCHEGIQTNISAALLPMAFTSPHLMTAVLCAAASHRLSVGLEQVSDVIRLRSIAIQQLNEALSSSSQDVWITGLGSSLVLCMSEIVSPEGTGGDWLVHLTGASALLRRIKAQNKTDESSMQFMRRFYASIKVIAAGCGISDGKDLFEEDTSTSTDFIDDLSGFSTSLVPIFEAISRINRREEASPEPQTADTDESIPGISVIPERARLIERVRIMLNIRNIKFRREVDDTLSTAMKTDFGLLDEAYHHMALLQLYEGHWEAADSSIRIQESVERIISCIGSMDIISKPCPGVATLPPLFAAGCAATKQRDRDCIAQLLVHVEECFGMGNVASTLKFLQSRWYLRGNELSRPSPRNLGFLPY